MKDTDDASAKTICRSGILYHPTMTARQRHVAACLVDHWDGQTENCYPSRQTLAYETGIDAADVRKTLNELCEGEDRLFDRTPGERGRGKSASYFPRMEVFEFYHLQHIQRRRNLDSSTFVPAAQYGGDEWSPNDLKGGRATPFTAPKKRGWQRR